MKSFGREKLVILALWFLVVIGIRMLLGVILSNMWVGTLGAVAITFAIFYFALTYSPLRKYSSSVDSALRDWYSKRFVFYSLLASTTVLLVLMLFVDLGYTYHADKLVTLSELESMDMAHKQMSSSIGFLVAQGYSSFDALSITIASVDKTLEGYYLRSVNFLFAENIEILAFLLFMRKVRVGGNLFLANPNRRNTG